MSLELILGVVFGGGFATLIATVAKVVDGRRRGQIESEDSVITRLEAENGRAKLRADAAEDRIDAAEAETVKYRKLMMKSEDKAALYKRLLIQNGIAVPSEGTDDED